MDRHSEHFVFNLLEQLRPQVMILFITHKPTLARTVNRIYPLENGHIQSISIYEQITFESIIL